MAVHKLAAILVLAALAGCAGLSAEQPLFPTPDQSAPPLTEGVWIAIGDECPERSTRQRRFPKECAPLDIRREADGAWRISFRVDLVSDMTASERASEAENPSNGPYRVVLAPAVERAIAEDAYAPLYVGEVVSIDREAPSIGYAVLAPIGAMPATEMRLNPMIGCASVLRDGPIEGISASYETRTDAQGQPYEDLVGCSASTQAGVREAARRAVIENVDSLTERRFVFVRAN